MKIFCFGNEFFKEDSLAREIAEEAKIPGVEFIPCDDPEEIFQYEGEGRELFILDVADVKETTLIENLDKIKELKPSTSHDLDLGFFLKLMEKLGRSIEVKIICVPSKGNKEKIIKEIKRILNKV